MSDKFKAVVLNQSGDQFSREIKTLDKSFLKDGDVLVKIDYSDLNLTIQSMPQIFNFHLYPLLMDHKLFQDEALNLEHYPFH